MLLSASLRVKHREAGCTKLGHLRKIATSSMDIMRESSNIMSFAEDHSLFEQWSDGSEGGGGQLPSFSPPQLDTFQAVERKAVYQVCVMVLHLRSLAGLKKSRGT